MAKKNREQRRHEKFGGGRANEAGGWPTSRLNPVFGGSSDPGETAAGAPDQEEPAKAATPPTKKPAAKRSGETGRTARSSPKESRPKD